MTPGVAYSTVPAWNTGDEVQQGTSMSAPRAAGLAALLASAAVQEKQALLARQIRQALVVTARPLEGATIVDEGGGLADIDSAYRWLAHAPAVPEVMVRAIGPGDATAAVLRDGGGAADTTQTFGCCGRRRPRPPATRCGATRRGSPHPPASRSGARARP